MKIKVLEGSIDKGNWNFNSQLNHISKSGTLNRQTLDLKQNIKNVTVLNQENYKSFTGTAGWGFVGLTVGGLLSGGVALAGFAGGLAAGGKKQNSLVAIELKDESKFLAEVNKKVLEELQKYLHVSEKSNLVKKNSVAGFIEESIKITIQDLIKESNFLKTGEIYNGVFRIFYQGKERFLVITNQRLIGFQEAKSIDKMCFSISIANINKILIGKNAIRILYQGKTLNLYYGFDTKKENITNALEILQNTTINKVSLIPKDQYMKKRDREIKIVVGTILAAVSGMFLWHQASTRLVQPKQSQVAIQNQVNQDAQKVVEDRINQDAQEIFKNITQSYKYSRFIDIWGVESKGIFLPEEAWSELSDDDQQILISYAVHNNLKAIIVGKLKSPNVIFIDRTVWGE